MTPPAPVERRLDSRIVRRALDEVKAIQALLADVYKDAGDGRTVVRELVQNADDAEAERLVFAVVEEGWPDATNSLLAGPALVVANSGRFPGEDCEALHQALGGSKAHDAGKVGRFGIGLKSVFHICEAFVYVGADRGVLRPGALNPWAGTGARGDADPLHPDWDSVEDDDLERLLAVARNLLGSFEDGLLQWIPLRRPPHLDRARERDRQYGLEQGCPQAEEVAGWFGQLEALTLLLAQCGHLVSIEVTSAQNPLDLASKLERTRVVRPAFQRRGWVGRPDDDADVSDRLFQGRIESGGAVWSVMGVEALGLDNLRRLRAASDWPADEQWRNGLSVLVPRKALAHAAITVLRPGNGATEPCGARLRWAVFLPLDNDPRPRPSALVDTVGRAQDSDAWDIIMHGYFWPSQDRRSIPGVTDDHAGTGDSAVRTHWNGALRDQLLLPLLPSALANAVKGVPENAARLLLEAVRDARTIRPHLSSVTRRHLLLPFVTEDGVRWEAHRSDGARILSIPRWTQAPRAVREQFGAQWVERSDGVVFIDESAPRLGGEVGTWPLDWVECLLSCISSESLQSLRDLNWIEALLSHLLGSPADVTDDRTAAAARWLAARIADGVLSIALDGTAADERAAASEAWRRVFATLPSAWRVDAPKATHSAVVELANAGAFGIGLLTVPLGRLIEADRLSRPETARLDRALQEIGARLEHGGDTSQRVRRSRLLLAETLLSVRDAEPLSEELGRLPLLRARRLPADTDEAWSMTDLRHQAERHRVFAKPSEDEEDEAAALDAPSDPKRAVEDLAEALSEAVWLVESSVASAVGVAVPTPAALALAVLSAEEIRSGPGERLGLLRRLARTEFGDNPIVQQAMIALLTGRAPGTRDDHKLYYVRKQDFDRLANRESLEILLRLLGRAWCSVDLELVEPLTNSLVDELRLTAVDFGALHELLRESLDASTDWSTLERSEVLHLLRHLHGATADDRTHWREMPLHRVVGGGRRQFDERALRAVGGRRLPSELESETVLLDPDPEIADLYHDVPVLDDDGLLHAMLVSHQPYRFAEQIAHTLRVGVDGHIILPRNPELRELLRDASWLPQCDGGSGLAPQVLLVLPRALQESVAPLAGGGALGVHHLVEEIDPSVWAAAAEAVHELLGRPSRAQQVERLAAALDTSRVGDVDSGAYALLSDADWLDLQLIDDAISSVLAGSHRGWGLVRAAARALEVGSGRPLPAAPVVDQDAIIGVARGLCANAPAERQVSTLKVLATARPAKESAAGRLFRRLVEHLAQSPGFFEQVLPWIELPTQDGQWHEAREIARSASGVARRHRGLAELRGPLRLDRDEPVPERAISEIGLGSGTAQVLEEYFRAWIGRVPAGAVGAFLAVLGDGKDEAIVRLSRQWFGDDVSVEGMRRALSRAAESDPCASVKVFVSGRVARGQPVEAVNLLGDRVQMEAEAGDDSVFASDPVRRSSALGDFWEVALRDVEPHHRTADELVALLGGTIEWWAVRVLRIDLQTVRSWWSKWGIGGQAQIGPVQASILAHLPLTLQQLDVRDCPALNDALRKAQRSQRIREQAPPAQLREAIDAERGALGHLASMIRGEAEYQRFVWTRVQEQMRRFGYRADGVLLELAQNADDALSQAAEIAGSPLPPAARRLIVRVAERDGVPTIDVIHYGRSINDTGGPAFATGRDRQWDQDLYFMMLLNLSGKPGDVPGRTTAASTTGEFGLGFKSVHLVSEKPSVVSGYLAFSIVGGLLPLEHPVPNEPDLRPVDGHLATRIRLPLRGDVDGSDLVDKIFRRFAYARALLPAFSRGIREVVVDGGPYAGVTAFHGTLIDGAAGWSVSNETVNLAEHGEWRLLRFRLADAAEGLGTTAFVIGLREGKPVRFPSDLPFLWNVAPTSETWDCGYAVNGPFKLDPGRTHVSLDDGATLRVMDLLGEALGKGLVDLHDALVNGGPGAASGLPAGEGAVGFLAQLWRVLASDIDSLDEQRRNLLVRLQGPGRGLSRWMSARSVVPSGLPAPFSDRLPALTAGMRIEVAVAGLDDPGLCQAFARVGDLASAARAHRAVSSEIAQHLRPLLSTAPRSIRPWDILHEVAERWDQVLTPERLHALRPLVEDVLWKTISNDPQGRSWSSELVARAAAGSLVPLRGLLVPRDLVSEEADEAVEDELRRAAFAPDERVLNPAYIAGAVDRTMFLRLRGRHEIDAATMASWYSDLPVDRRPAGLRYLLDGRLQHEVLERLVPIGTRPHWLQEYDEVRLMLGDLREDQWQTQALLAALFPDRFEPAPVAIQAVPTLPESVRRRFFGGLEEWWNEEDVRRGVIDYHEEQAWPAWLGGGEGIAAGLTAGSQDHWLALLVLGACRSLGRAQAAQHRSFLDSAYGEGWWEVFRDPDNTAAWMDVLRVWQDRSVDSLKFMRWMSLFPAIYQLSRYLETYRRLLRSAGRRPAELYRVTRLLAPRVDEALSGAGRQFDAPPAPLNMGLHWVLRELVRLRVLDGDHLLPDCWVPSEQLLRFLRPLGLDALDSDALNSEKARAVFDFLASELRTPRPHLHWAFDIPLRHVDTNADLRRQFGLEHSN